MDELSAAKTSRGGLVTLRNVLRLRLLFGFYSPISPSPILCHLARLYCICFALLTSTIMSSLIPDLILQKFLFSFLIFEYNFHVLLCLFTGEKHIFKFCKCIEQVDTEIGSDHMTFITPAVEKLFLSFCVLNALSASLFVYRHIVASTFIYILVSVIGSAVNFTGWTYIVALDLLRHRLSLLRSYLMLNLRRDIRSRSDINRQIKTIFNCLKLYRRLIDSLDVIFPWTKLQMLVSFAAALIAVLGRGHMVIVQIHEMYDKMSFFGVIYIMMDILRIATICIVACLPAVITELIIREADNLKVVFGDELLISEDADLRRVVEVAIEYLQLRSLRVTICRVLVVDATLVLAIVGFCASNLIIILQLIGLF